jgi:ubiquinone/menaquinone biosynthesis C-methylase UbiE
VTRLLAPLVRSIRAFDGSPHMLEKAKARLTETGLTNWQTEVADHSQLPAADGSADLAVEGWSFGHYAAWNPDTWREKLAAALSEMRRVLRPGGTAILIETLGTGYEKPHIVFDGLGALLAVLAWEYGCQSTWIRTDYDFESLDEAEQLCRFFFGDALADRVRREGLVRLPECTGLWWLKK